MQLGLDDPTRVLLIAQLLIQIVLIAFVVFLLVQENRRKLKPQALDELKAVVKQTQEITSTFHSKVQQNIELVKNVMNDLDGRIRTAEVLIKALEETSVKAKKARQFGSNDVQKLNKAGFDDMEISQITGIPLGEIQLMIKVGSSQD